VGTGHTLPVVVLLGITKLDKDLLELGVGNEHKLKLRGGHDNAGSWGNCDN
jgi:hypothetical protein